MKLTLSLLAALLFSLSSAMAQDTNFWIFLCFGQSNMESGGPMNDADRNVDKRLQVMADADSAKRGWKKGEWYDAIPPLSTRGSGICMVDYFGRTMVSNLPPNIRIGIIKVSIPGTKIEMFQKDIYTNYLATVQSWMLSYVKAYGGNPYQYMVDQAKLAQQQGVIKGFLLHQGESNPNDHEWPNKVKSIYDNLVKDLKLPTGQVPFLAGETVNADQQGVCAGFNTIMADLPKTLPTARVVSSAGCTCNPDHMHFNSAGSREFGKRYGEIMLEALGYKLLPPATTPAEPTVK